MKPLHFFIAWVILFLGGVLMLVYIRPEGKSVLNPYVEIGENIKDLTFTPRPPKVEEIFSNDHGFVATLSAQRVRTVYVTGDLIPGRMVNYNSIQKNDFLWAYRDTADLLRQGDITFVNLEAPLLEKCPLATQGFVFCGDKKHIDGLLLLGVDVANIANNHIHNYGTDGIDETISILKESGIQSAGGIEIPVVAVRGLTFAFVGFNDIGYTPEGVNNAEEETIRAVIMKAEERADVVIAQFHWGVEYVAEPNERQKSLARLAVDSGADLVVGNHPHWIQPVEIYNDVIISYAHGNYIFDQMWSEQTRLGVIGKYTFYDKKLIDVEFIPTQIFEYGRSELVTDSVLREKILQDMKEESLKLEIRDVTPL